MTKVIAPLSVIVGVALAASHAAKLHRAQYIADEANELIARIRQPARTILAYDTDTMSVLRACRSADRDMSMLMRFDFGDWGAVVRRGDDWPADLSEISALEEAAMQQCAHVPFDDVWQHECTHTCYVAWSWLRDELERIRADAANDGASVISL
jgi:hypothetical protein